MSSEAASLLHHNAVPFFFLPLPAAARSLRSHPLNQFPQRESIVGPIFQFCSSESVKEEGAVTLRLQGELKDREELNLHHDTLTLTLAVSGTTLLQKGCVY